MYGVNRVSLDSMLTLRSCHLFLISALKQYSLVHETHLNGVRLADQHNEFGTQVCLCFPGAFDCRLHLACSVSHAGRNIQSLAYWSGMEPQETTFTWGRFHGNAPQGGLGDKSEDTRAPTPTRFYSRKKTAFHAKYTGDGVFLACGGGAETYPGLFFHADAHPLTFSAKIVHLSHSSPLAHKRPAKAGQKPERENTQ